MRKGFKSWCETIAIKCRKELNLESFSPLNPLDLARHLKITVLKPVEIESIAQNDIFQLLENDPDSWSAVAIYLNDTYLIIYNSSHAPTRQANNIMHELAHILVGHKPNQNCFSCETGLFLRYYEKEQEEEADWLAATLLLPKDALFLAKKQSKSISAISKEYGVSEALVTMRLNTSGANKVYSRIMAKK